MMRELDNSDLFDATSRAKLLEGTPQPVRFPNMDDAVIRRTTPFYNRHASLCPENDEQLPSPPSTPVKSSDLDGANTARDIALQVRNLFVLLWEVMLVTLEITSVATWQANMAIVHILKAEVWCFLRLSATWLAFAWAFGRAARHVALAVGALVLQRGLDRVNRRVEVEHGECGCDND
jgi:hypothetical protein